MIFDRASPRGPSRSLVLSGGAALLYPRPLRRRDGQTWLARAAPWLVSTVVAALMVFPALGSTPGMHGDEAWILGRVRDLMGGARPADGMNFYTGALHQYLVWPFVAAFGETIWAVRLPGALLWVTTVALITGTLRRRLGDAAAMICGLLLATSPAFALFARFGIELTALSPFLTVAALVAAARIGDGCSAWDFALAQVAGLALGLLVYNHVVALPVPLALGAMSVVRLRGRLLRSPAAGAALFGFALGCLPRLVDVLHPARHQAWHKGSGWSAALADLSTLPMLLARCWDGAWLYRRFAGGGTVPVVPYTLAALLLVVMLRVRSRTPPSPLGVWAAATTALGAVATCLLAPHLALRYFVVVHAAIPVLFGMALAPLLGAGGGMRRAAVVVAGTVMACNVFYLVVNVVVPFERAGGGLLTFPIGRRLIESSNHFIRTDRLYQALRSAGVVRVDAQELIAWCIQAHDRTRALSFGAPVPSPHDGTHARERTAFVTYDTPGSPAPPVIERSGLKLGRALTHVPMFRIYISPP